MKAVILAAGMGTRLEPYTKNSPKGMLEILGTSIIEHQIKLFQEVGIQEIAIVTGYKSEMITFKNISYYHNKNYASTNMVETLMCAKDFFNDDIIVSYSDILFSKKLLKSLILNTNSIVVSADDNWKQYWNFRYKTIDYDLESFTIDEGKVVHLGKELNSSKNLNYRYIGIMKFSKASLPTLLNIYHNKKISHSNWENSNNTFLKGYMTDLLQELIDNNVHVYPDIVSRGWLEFDTVDDYELVINLLKTNSLEEALQI